MASVGVIDLGSNAIRLQIAQVYEGGLFTVVYDERDPVRLGENVFRTRQLSPAAMDRSLESLRRFTGEARARGVSLVRAVATSAVREADNGAEFLAVVERETGLRPEVISGEREARIIARGVLSCFSSPHRRVALADIGGGSTEISIAERGLVTFAQSVAIGSVRATELFCRTDPLSREDERRLRIHVRNLLRRYVSRARVPSCETVVGSAGSIGALGAFIRRQPVPEHGAGRLRAGFTVAELSRARATLTRMDLETRRKAPGIEERRSEIIVAGSIILEEICHHLKARVVKTVRRGLRDGLMIEELERLGFPNPRAMPRGRLGTAAAVPGERQKAG